MSEVGPDGVERRRQYADLGERIDVLAEQTRGFISSMDRLSNVIDRVGGRAENAEHVATETSQMLVHNSAHIKESQSTLARRVAAGLLIVLVVTLAGGWLIVHHQSVVIAHRNQVARESCESRNSSQHRTGSAIETFLTGLEDVERSNPNKTLGADRIAVYERARAAFRVGSLPNCAALYPHTTYTAPAAPAS